MFPRRVIDLSWVCSTIVFFDECVTLDLILLGGDGSSVPDRSHILRVGLDFGES